MTLQWLYVTSATAWLAIALIVATFALPYLARRTMVSPRLGFCDLWPGSARKRMLPHIWLGYATVALAAIHSAAAMNLGDLTTFDPTGLALATFALASLLVIFALGRRLTQSGGPNNGVYRTWHFWLAIVLVAATFGHTLLNSPTVRILIR